MDRRLNPVRFVGALALSVVREGGNMVLFLGEVVAVLLTTPPKIGLILKRIRFIGFHSLLIVCLSGLFTGMVLGFQGYYMLEQFDARPYLGPMVGLALIRELGPVLAALMVTGRAGSALAAEIGIMRIGEEIDALKLMGLSPFRYLIVPNVVAAVICLPLLTAIFDVCGILGGYLTGVKLLGIGAGMYFDEMAASISRRGLENILGGMYKGLSFGGFMAWICCYKGYTTGFGAEGVSKATTQAVVLTSVVILAWDYFMTSILW